MELEASMYPGRGKHMPPIRRGMRGYNEMNSEHEDRDDYYRMSDTFNDKQTDRDWDRRLSRERINKNRCMDYPGDDDERSRYSMFDGVKKHSKQDYKRYCGMGDKRQGREDSDRRLYYDNSPRPRDFRDVRDISVCKDGTRDLRDFPNSSRDSSRRRDYRDSRGGREQVDCRDMKDMRNSRGSSRELKSIRDRDRRDLRLHDREYDMIERMDDRDKHSRLKDNGSPESLDNYDSINDYHGIRGSLYGPGDSRYHMDGESYKNQAPNNTVMIRGLAQHITENDIRQDILQCGLMPKDIRLIRKKDTGASRGFAFVEFNTLQEASRWMEMKQGVLMLQDQYRAVMHFSIPKDPSYDRALLKSGNQDWHCVKCGAHNFKRRDTCFKCHASRQESEEGGEGSDEVSPHPTHTVLLRSLDVLSTEDSVLQALQRFSSLPIRSIRIGQDALTNTSRGICYVELNNVLDSVYLHDALIADPLVVDGRKVLVSYCKLPQMMLGPTANAQSSESDSQWGPHSGDISQYGADDIPRLAEYCASLYATSPQEHTVYLQYYQQYYENQLAQGGTLSLPSQSQTDSVNAAAALAQSAIQQVQAAREIKKQIEDPRQMKPEDKLAYEVFKIAQMKTHGGQTPLSTLTAYHPTPPTNIPSSSTSILPFIVPTQGTALPKYPVPDVSTYQYDETSGYYYDSQTGLYYDATSQYYYNAQTQQFLYWEADKQTYMPAPMGSDDGNPSKDEGKKGKERDRQDKVKVAKKIAKDMERWAKTLNQKKDNARQNLTFASTAVPSSKSVGAADAGYAILERKERMPSDLLVVQLRDSENLQGTSPSLQGGANASGLVAAYGGGSESDEEIEDVLQEDKQHTNWVKLACLLCKRQFPSKESLMRHQQLSDLHKQNLDNWYRVRGLDPHDPQQRNNKYRDRAKERRLKFGEPNPPHPNRLKEKYLKAREEAVSTSYEEPTKAGIGSENVGNKLLQKMGWQEGMGLGKSNQGRTSIIQTEHRNSTAGLGSKDGSYGALPGETYKDCVKKMMFARYQELTEQEQSLES